MSAARRIRELADLVRQEPGNLVARLKLAAALREAGRKDDAIEMYRGVAIAYASDGRFAQAIAVCKGILELDPRHEKTMELCADIAARTADGTTQSVRVLSISGRWVAVPASAIDPMAAARATNSQAEVDHLTETGAAESTQVDPQYEPVTGLERPRFSAPPPRADAGLGILPGEEPELDDDMILASLPAPPVPEGPGGRPRPGASSLMPSCPLFYDLPRAAFVDLLQKITVRREEAGVAIVREGEPGDAFYVISAGTVRVLKKATDGQQIELARLGPGSFFGEFALFGDRRRHASVEATESLELLEISRQVLADLTADHPGVEQTLRRFYRERLLETLMQTAPFFRPLGPDVRARLAARFRAKRVVPGETVLVEGAPGGGLYLVLLGRVEITRRGDDGRPIRLGELGEGSYFGEMSLLRGGAASATVAACVPTEVAELAAKDFYQILSQHPALWTEIRQEAKRREEQNERMLVGRADL